MKILFLNLCAIFCTVMVSAQEIITGKVVDAGNQPIEFASVALYILPDSVVIGGTVTDSQGAFSLSQERQMGKELCLKIAFVGYESRVVPVETG